MRAMWAMKRKLKKFGCVPGDVSNRIKNYVRYTITVEHALIFHRPVR